MAILRGRGRAPERRCSDALASAVPSRAGSPAARSHTFRRQVPRRAPCEWQGRRNFNGGSEGHGALSRAAMESGPARAPHSGRTRPPGRRAARAPRATPSAPHRRRSRRPGTRSRATDARGTSRRRGAGRPGRSGAAPDGRARARRARAGRGPGPRPTTSARACVAPSRAARPRRRRARGRPARRRAGRRSVRAPARAPPRRRARSPARPGRRPPTAARRAGRRDRAVRAPHARGGSGGRRRARARPRRPRAGCRRRMRWEAACADASGAAAGSQTVLAVPAPICKTRIMSVLKVARLGHPVLRQVAEPVSPEAIGAPEFQHLIDDMFETMDDYDGAGLAAPQVHVSRRIVIYGVASNPRYPDAEAVPATALINPKLTPLTQQQEEDWEGCLSVPDLRGKVPRLTRVRVEAYGREG